MKEDLIVFRMKWKFLMRAIKAVCELNFCLMELTLVNLQFLRNIFILTRAIDPQPAPLNTQPEKLAKKIAGPTLVPITTFYSMRSKLPKIKAER